MAVDLVNAFVVDTSADDPAAVEALGRTLAVDPPSVAQLALAVVPEFRALGGRARRGLRRAGPGQRR